MEFRCKCQATTGWDDQEVQLKDMWEQLLQGLRCIMLEQSHILAHAQQEINEDKTAGIFKARRSELSGVLLVPALESIALLAGQELPGLSALKERPRWPPSHPEIRNSYRGQVRPQESFLQRSIFFQKQNAANHTRLGAQSCSNLHQWVQCSKT